MSLVLELVTQLELNFAQFTVYMDLKIKPVPEQKLKKTVLIQKVNNFISIQKNVSIAVHVNLNVLLKLFLKRVKFQRNGIALLKLIMNGLARNTLADFIL